jgi:hypothetical protein
MARGRGFTGAGREHKPSLALRCRAAILPWRRDRTPISADDGSIFEMARHVVVRRSGQVITPPWLEGPAPQALSLLPVLCIRHRTCHDSDRFLF